MKKTVLLAGLLVIPIALADGKWGCKGGEGASGMMSGYSIFGFWLLKLAFIVLGAFLFSLVFWQTYKWIIKGNNSAKKRK